jgi:hypothetical protein
VRSSEEPAVADGIDDDVDDADGIEVRSINTAVQTGPASMREDFKLLR